MISTWSRTRFRRSSSLIMTYGGSMNATSMGLGARRSGIVPSASAQIAATWSPQARELIFSSSSSNIFRSRSTIMTCLAPLLAASKPIVPTPAKRSRTFPSGICPRSRLKTDSLALPVHGRVVCVSRGVFRRLDLNCPPKTCSISAGYRIDSKRS